MLWLLMKHQIGKRCSLVKRCKWKDKSIDVARTARSMHHGKGSGLAGARSQRREMINYCLHGAGVHRGTLEFWETSTPKCASAGQKWAGEILEKKLIWWPPYWKCLKEFKMGKGNKFKEKCEERLKWDMRGRGQEINMCWGYTRK